MSRILGISGSLRNARFGIGSEKLIGEIKGLASRDDLAAYLQEQTKARVEDFLEAGRADGLPFNEIYRNLSKARGDRGLSNSEAALAAGLWGAWQQGADIFHTGLSKYFPMTGVSRHLDELRELVLAADGFLISGPVYFGDRGSLVQEFMEFLQGDDACAAHIKDKVYAGIAVGAKRNGGQETLLIYQMVDMANLNMLVVGNDSETTSQYGGTSLAGDVGTLFKDDYGINTSIGTGRQLGAVCTMLERAQGRDLNTKVRISIWMLQDSTDRRGAELANRLKREMEAANPEIDVQVMDFVDEEIYRCIACDICPTRAGPPEEYRCIINAEGDLFKRYHNALLETDAVLLAAYSPVDRHKVKSVYQRFIERTRYLRRDDYVFSRIVAAPLVFSELEARQNLHIRMLTSLIRQNTILHHPLLGMELEGEVLNWDGLMRQAGSFARNARRITLGRLSQSAELVSQTSYNPVGYEISAAKRDQDRRSGVMETIQQGRAKTHRERQRRLG